MKIKDIYKRVAQYWPSEIDVSDAVATEGGGLRSINLSSAWDEAEVKVNDEWETQMVWTIFRLLHNQMKSLEKTKLFPGSLDIESVNKEYTIVLAESGLRSRLNGLQK